MPDPRDGEGRASEGQGEGQPVYGGTMIHESYIPEGGSSTGAIADEGQIIDLGENPMYDDTDPVFQFRGNALTLDPDLMKTLTYILIGYFIVWKRILKK
jgi:hypothetical protein